MMKIIDNFLSKTYYNSILEILSGNQFDWKYFDNITEPQPKALEHFNGYGFSHIFWDEDRGSSNPLGPYMEPLLYQIMDVAECDLVLRARADMVTWTKDEYIHPPHPDFPFLNTAAIFYVNETDGDTIIYDVKPNEETILKLKELERVSPKPNRLVLFEGNILHTGCSPTKHKNRILINSNYMKNEWRDTEEFKTLVKKKKMKS